MKSPWNPMKSPWNHYQITMKSPFLVVKSAAMRQAAQAARARSPAGGPAELPSADAEGPRRLAATLEGRGFLNGQAVGWLVNGDEILAISSYIIWYNLIYQYIYIIIMICILYYIDLYYTCIYIYILHMYIYIYVEDYNNPIGKFLFTNQYNGMTKDILNTVQLFLD